MSADATVLVVDDEDRLRRTLMQMVQSLGFTACGAGTAEEAACILQSVEPPQIVVLDLQLPVMHGLDLFDWIARERPDTRVIILTGFGGLDSAQRAIRLGVVDYLTKPCTMGELDQALGRALGMTRECHAGGLVGDDPDDSARQEPRTLDELQRRHILDALQRHAGNRRRAAAELGISLRTLYYRLAQYESE